MQLYSRNYIVVMKLYVHPVSITRFPSFRTQTLENLSRYLWTKRVPEQPRPWRKSCERESCNGDWVYNVKHFVRNINTTISYREGDGRWPCQRFRTTTLFITYTKSGTIFQRSRLFKLRSMTTFGAGLAKLLLRVFIGNLPAIWAASEIS